MIASGACIAMHAYKIQKEYHAEKSLIIVSAFMENAVEYIKENLDDDIDVIIGRGNTAKMLRAERLPFPIVEIPISNHDIHLAVEKAASLMNSRTGKLAYIGEEKSLASANVFLSRLGYKLSLYPCLTSQDIRSAVNLAKKEHVKAIIGGVFTYSIATSEKIPCVILEASYESVLQAYTEAISVQKATELKKETNIESRTILESISDGILAIDRNGIIRYCNKPATRMLQCQPDPAGLRAIDILPKEENTMLQLTLKKGKRYTRHAVKIQDKIFLLSFSPVTTSSTNTGAIISMKPQSFVIPDQSNQLSLKGEGFLSILGKSPTFRFAIEAAKQCARDATPVLIIGEYGTGKSMLAKAIHDACSTRNVFIARSSMTVSLDDILSCQSGTLYISKVEDLNLQLQESIAQIVSDSCIRMDDGEIIHVNFKLICSTETNLKQRTAHGQFSKKLYYVLTSHLIPLPPLRERGDDILLLFSRFLDEKGLSFSGTLPQYSWPGNIQEMKCLVDRLSLRCNGKGIVTTEMILKELGEDAYFSLFDSESKRIPIVPRTEKTYFIGGNYYTREDLLSLKAFYNGKVSLMASQLKCSRSTLWRYFKELNPH